MIERFTVVLVSYPFSEKKNSKVRPALVLTDVVGDYNHVIIAYISSKVPETLLETDVLISKESKGFEISGLIVSSVIRLHKMTSIPDNLVMRKLGVLSEIDQQQVKSQLKNLFNY
jgi:mRNA interferase MazF